MEIELTMFILKRNHELNLFIMSVNRTLNADTFFAFIEKHRPVNALDSDKLPVELTRTANRWYRRNPKRKPASNTGFG